MKTQKLAMDSHNILRLFKLMPEIINNCRDKEVNQLTDQEIAALAIVSGCEYEVSTIGIQVKNPISVNKIDGKFIIYEKI